MPNIQVTHGLSPSQARSESAIAVHPANPHLMVAASRRFTDPAAYQYSVATSWSHDGGHTWHPSGELSLGPDWIGLKSPSLVWDETGSVHLCAAPYMMDPSDAHHEFALGAVVYRSTDGGMTWGAPAMVHSHEEFDKPRVAADRGGHYPGHLYTAWAVAETDPGSWGMGFARSTDHGATWTPGGLDLDRVDEDFSMPPVIAVAPSNGNVYIAWHWFDQMLLLVSKDGGDTFLPAIVAASGITTLESSLAMPGPPPVWPHFPGGHFLVGTRPTLCAGAGNTVAIAWADYRHGVSRVYYALSHDAGATWTTAPSGNPMIATHLAGMQHFDPQLAATPAGVIGCAYYEFGAKPVHRKIDTKLAWSLDAGATFPHHITVTDHPWDPAVDAPHWLGNPTTTDLGDYFGLDASAAGFHPLWTDTRTGIEELFTQRVKVRAPLHLPHRDFGAIAAEILFGVTQDGGGVVRIGGHLHRVPPYDPGPASDILYALASQRLAGQIRSKEGTRLQQVAMELVAKVAIREAQRLEDLERKGEAANARELAEAGSRN